MRLHHTTAIAAFLTLAACSNGATQLPSAPAPAAGRFATALPNPPRTWMASDAKRLDLLYVSARTVGELDAFSFPGGQLEGQVTNLRSPAGLCVDRAGNVWVALQGSGLMEEFAHAGTRPIKKLNPRGIPVGCAIDPSTGNLAVTTYFSTGSKPGDVAIFKNAAGNPKLYADSQTFYGAYCGYDNKGNLFADATRSTQGNTFLFAELAKGSHSLKNITLRGGRVYFPGQVQWDGKYVAVADQAYNDQSNAAIYRTTGASGKIVGSTVFVGAGDIVQLWIQGQTVVAPNISFNRVFLYKYPQGGLPRKTITQILSAFGATVSLAK